MDNVLAERLYIARITADLTQDELAEKTGLTKGTISRYESGYIQTIKTKRLNDLSAALNVSLKWLLGFTEDMHDY